MRFKDYSTKLFEEEMSGCFSNVDCPSSYTCVNGECREIEEEFDEPETITITYLPNKNKDENRDEE